MYRLEKDIWETDTKKYPQKGGTRQTELSDVYCSLSKT